MDLGTMQRKVIAYAYRDLAAFEHDFDMVCSNALVCSNNNASAV